MHLDWETLFKIAIPIVTLAAGAILNKLIEDRPRLATYYSHAGALSLNDPAGQNPPIQVHIHSVVVRNTGRKAATNVRLGHNTLPSFNVYPPIKHEVERATSGAAEIIFPVLVPKEQVTISYIYFPPLLFGQINTFVKSDEGLAKVLEVLPTPQAPKWLIRIAVLLILVGAISLVYVVIVAALHLLRQAG